MSQPEQTIHAGARGADTHPAWGAPPVSSIMTRHVVLVSDGLSIADVSRLLVGARTTSAAVVDAAGAIVGHVSMIDIVRGQCVDVGPAVVRDIMRPFLLQIGEGDSVGCASALMAFENIDHVFVMAPDGRMVGWVSALEVLRAAAAADGYPGIRARGVTPGACAYAPQGREEDRGQ